MQFTTRHKEETQGEREREREREREGRIESDRLGPCMALLLKQTTGQRDFKAEVTVTCDSQDFLLTPTF